MTIRRRAFPVISVTRGAWVRVVYTFFGGHQHRHFHGATLNSREHRSHADQQGEGERDYQVSGDWKFHQ